MTNKLFTTPYSAKKGAVAAARKAGLPEPIETYLGEGGKWFVKDLSRFANVDPVALDTGGRVLESKKDDFEMTEAELALQQGRVILSEEAWAADCETIKAGVTDAQLLDFIDKWGDRGSYFIDALPPRDDNYEPNAMTPKVITPGFVPAGTALAADAAGRIVSQTNKDPVASAPRTPVLTATAPAGTTKKGQVADMLRAGGATIPDIVAKLGIGEQAARSLIGDLRNDGLNVKSARVQGARHVLYTL